MIKKTQSIFTLLFKMIKKPYSKLKPSPKMIKKLLPKMIKKTLSQNDWKPYSNFKPYPFFNHFGLEFFFKNFGLGFKIRVGF